VPIVNNFKNQDVIKKQDLPRRTKKRNCKKRKTLLTFLSLIPTNHCSASTHDTLYG